MLPIVGSVIFPVCGCGSFSGGDVISDWQKHKLRHLWTSRTWAHTSVPTHFYFSSGSHPPSPSLVWEKEQSISNVLSSKSNKPLKAGKLWALLIFIHQTCACFMSGQSVHSYTQILCPICHTWSINPFFHYTYAHTTLWIHFMSQSSITNK